MPNFQVDLAAALITTRYGRKFGHLVRVIGGADYITLKQIEARLYHHPDKSDIKIKQGEVEPILALLIWHKYADYKQQNKSTAVYALQMAEILRISTYPRYMYHMNELFGDRGRSMIENILLHGRLDQQTIIREQIKVELGTDSQDLSMIEEVNGVFKDMVGTNFIKREANLSEESMSINPVNIPKFDAIDELEQYSVNWGEFTDEPKSRLEEAKTVYWSINGTRFDNYIRDQIMVDDAAEACGPLAGQVLRNTLRISEHGSSELTVAEYTVSYHQILAACNEAQLVFQDMSFDLVLMLLVKGEFLAKSQDGSYKILMRDIIKRCFRQSVLQWICTKYGVEARKVLHLLQSGSYYEPSTIAKKCLIDDREAKRVIYRK